MLNDLIMNNNLASQLIPLIIKEIVKMANSKEDREKLVATLIQVCMEYPELCDALYIIVKDLCNMLVKVFNYDFEVGKEGEEDKGNTRGTR